MGGFNFGAFAGGVANGVQAGTEMELARNRDKRAQEESELNKTIKKIGIGRMEKEEPILDKELQARGLKADYNMNEQNFASTMQDYEQNTRRLLAQGKRSEAQTAITAAQTAGVAATDAAQRQPDELAMSHDQLRGQIADSIQRQTANVWNALKLGNNDLAVQMFNDSKLVSPGQKVKSFKLESVDGPPGADGQPTKVQYVTGVPEGDGQPIRMPVSALERMSQTYGAKYEKVGNNLVRIDSQGKVTPIYETDQMMAVPEGGSVVSKRTGQPPAAGGINGESAGTSRKATAATDDRVKMAIDKVILPKFGGRFEGGMFFPDKDNKDIALRSAVLTEQYIRQDKMDPVAAANKAIGAAEREKALAGTGGKPGGGSGGPAYTGPTPWK